MSTSKNYKLIDGIFTAAEAKTVLFSLVESKIRYHQMEKFSNQERFGSDINHSEKRVKQLRKLLDSLKASLEKAEAQNKRIKINGNIGLIFIDT